MEDLKGRHGGHALCARDVRLGVDIDLGESDLLGAGMLVGKALEMRCNHFARTAPVGVDLDSLLVYSGCSATALATVVHTGDREMRVQQYLQSAMTTVVPESSDCHSPVDPIFTRPLILFRFLLVEDEIG